MYCLFDDAKPVNQTSSSMLMNLVSDFQAQSLTNENESDQENFYHNGNSLNKSHENTLPASSTARAFF